MGTRPSKNLAWFITVANAAMTEVKAPGIFDFADDLDRFPVAQRDTAELLSSTPFYLKEKPGETLKLNECACAIRGVLLSIARAAKAGVKQHGAIPFESTAFSAHHAVEFTEAGTLRVVPSDQWDAIWYTYFLDALRDVDAGRIRECEICGNVYWAVRRDKMFCSDGCRVKQWSKKNPQRWNEIQLGHETRR